MREEIQDLRFKIQEELGFTLVELLISISILSGMTYISVRKFQMIQQDDSLNLAAGRIVEVFRKAQNYAQSGTQVEFPLANGYGVRVDKADGTNVNGSALFFADLNSLNPTDPSYAGRWQWDGGILQGANVRDIQIGTAVSPDVTRKNQIVIESVTVGSTAVNGANVFYHSPTASGRIDGALTDDRVVITLKNKKNNRTKEVIVNRVSGKVEIGS